MSSYNILSGLTEKGQEELLSNQYQRKQERDGDEERPAGQATSKALSCHGAEDEVAAKYKLKNPIVWMDLEMTGLDPDKDQILEIAVLITDGNLTAPHLEGPDLAIHQPDEVLDSMNEWCIKNHGKSGLTQKCRDSTIPLEEAESQVLHFLQKHTQSVQAAGSAQHKGHLAGNSIYMDHAFLRRHMPRVAAHLHWRLIDISTLLELARRWYPDEFKKAPKKKVSHTAMADIRESLSELKYYKKYIFKQPGVSYREYLNARGGIYGGDETPESRVSDAQQPRLRNEKKR